MAEFRFIGRGEAQEMHDFSYPICMESIGPMMTGGPSTAEYIFGMWTSAENIRRDMDSGTAYAYLTDGGRKVGFLAFRIEGEKLHVCKCYLAEGERGKGLGSEMLRMMLKYGKEHGCTSAYLHVDSHNAPAMGMYAKNGFSVDYREIEDQGNGFSTNNCVMSRRL